MPRDTAGNYTLPAGNPVASGEIISASWANSTMNDLGQSLSASLDRYGRGGMLAPFQFTDGTESAPGATWSNEPTTGLYRAAYGDLRFTLTGTDVQRWTSANSYLWRNSQWEEILTQTGGGGSTTINNLVVTGSFTSPGIDDNATSTAITIDASQNVGIGTNVPTYTLHTIGDSLLVHDPDGSNTALVAVGSGGTSNVLIDGDTIQMRGETGAVQVTKDASGNVGIGTGSPNAALNVSSTVNPTFRLDNPSGIARFNMYDSATFVGQIAASTGNGLELSAVGGRNISAYTNSQERMVITSTGDVTIGSASTYLTAANRRVLQATGGTDGSVMSLQGTTGDFYIHSGGGNTPDVSLVNRANGYMNFFTNNTERMRIDSSGNLLVGASSQSNVENATEIGISLSGASVYRSSKTATTVNTHMLFINPNGVVGSISTTGSATTYSTSSDERLKENIVDAPAGNIDSIKVRSFDWKADGEHQDYGFIAQELETVAPYAVTKGETDEDMWAVDYSKLVPMLVKEIQDLKAEVAALKGA